MTTGTTHITGYRTLARILIILLFLTAFSVLVTYADFRSLTIVVALTVACVKAALVLSYFMHLKYEHMIFRIMAGMVFLLIAIVLVLTFFDYMFR